MAYVEPYDPSKDARSDGKYPNIDPKKIRHIEIFPPIGISRLGDSNDEYFYGPEVPGRTDHPFGTFRDRDQRIKRQAARFRVYAYGEGHQALGELNLGNGFQLHWTVHVANKKPAYYHSRGQYRVHPQDPDPKTLRNPDVEPIPEEALTADPFDTATEARKRLIIDPGKKTIHRGPNDPPEKHVKIIGEFRGSKDEPTPVYLGELRTDVEGRLVFLGGNGRSRSLNLDDHLGDDIPKDQPDVISEFDSVDWCDDVCDGWVDVSVVHPDCEELQNLEPRRATVICAPTKFAWGVYPPTSLYNLMEDKYSKVYESHELTDFMKDIWPVFSSTYTLSWTNNLAYQGHGYGGKGYFASMEDKLRKAPKQGEKDEYKALREHIFERLRVPDYKNKDQANVKYMPRLSGNDGDAIEPGSFSSDKSIENPIQRFAYLTPLQYKRFEDWKDGKFQAPDEESHTRIEDYDVEEQPLVLTRAMLEQTIGEPLFPGIEAFWIMRFDGVFDMTVVNKNIPPFRIDHERVLPGYLTRGLSLPWQADFDLCNTHWWPSARPDDVFVVPQDKLVERLPEDKLLPYISDLKEYQKGWTRGLRDSPDDSSTNFFPGSTDMVRFWQLLGFVEQKTISINDQEKVPIWIETERKLKEPADSSSDLKMKGSHGLQRGVSRRR
ncbi:hypothetical protein CPB86DRAFT_522864 [Serendipita vermifera]|nr:hypothetical protein CPB86DRAFT_522864 [Serendipita vermifera]